MDKLVQRQQEVLECIRQIDRNFSKDSASRKTRDYIIQRLEKLDKLWAEFNSNHSALDMYRHEDVGYFAGNQYDQARKYYEEVRSKVASHPLAEEDVSAPGSSKIAPIKYVTRSQASSPVPPAHSGSSAPLSDKAANYLSLQRTNFRAFTRLIAERWHLKERGEAFPFCLIVAAAIDGVSLLFGAR
ncbi:unnamed protein product [Leptosia nina]|uniref:Uncharacterized protein n=1 Tax=Leptosia nina TaxID=320188 RepID=A0AAV1JBU2_9NEOP